MDTRKGTDLICRERMMEGEGGRLETNMYSLSHMKMQYTYMQHIHYGAIGLLWGRGKLQHKQAPREYTHVDGNNFTRIVGTYFAQTQFHEFSS